MVCVMKIFKNINCASTFIILNNTSNPLQRNFPTTTVMINWGLQNVSSTPTSMYKTQQQQDPQICSPSLFCQRTAIKWEAPLENPGNFSGNDFAPILSAVIKCCLLLTE